MGRALIWACDLVHADGSGASQRRDHVCRGAVAVPNQECPRQIGAIGFSIAAL